MWTALLAFALSAQAPAAEAATPPTTTTPTAEATVTTPPAPTTTAEPAPTTTPTTTPTTPPTTTTPPTATTATTATTPWRQTVGVSLVAGGAGLAAAGTAGLTLVQALSTPDRRGNPVPETQRTLTENTGFVVAGVVSVSAVAMVVGASMLLIDEAPTTTTTPTPANSDAGY